MIKSALSHPPNLTPFPYSKRELRLKAESDDRYARAILHRLQWAKEHPPVKFEVKLADVQRPASAARAQELLVLIERIKT